MQNENKNPRKPLYLAMAILVALVIWFYVDEFGDNGSARLIKKEFDDIPIEYTHEETLMDRGLMLVEDGSDQTVSIQLETTRRLMAEIDRDNIHVVADLSDISEAGSQSVQPRLTYIGYRLSGQRITITQSMVKEMNPFTATVNVKELNSKPVEIRCELRGNVAEGYSAGQLKISDSTIEIWGQAEDIDPVSYGKVTLDIGDDAVSSVSESLPITFYDENNQKVDAVGIRSTAQEVKVTMPVSVTRELRLDVQFKDAPGVREKNVSYEIKPKTITVSGDASQLNGIDSIVLSEFDLLELKANNGSGVFEYPITVPEGCANLSGVTRATLTIALNDLTTTEITTDQFVYENLPAGKSVKVLTEEMTISLFGTKADISALTPEKVFVMADLGDYSEASGIYTVPAKVKVEGNGDVGITGEYEIRVDIYEETQEKEEQQENEPTGEVE